MNGVECVKEISKLENKPVVIMITAMGQESFVREALVNGASGFYCQAVQRGNRRRIPV